MTRREIKKKGEVSEPEVKAEKYNPFPKKKDVSVKPVMTTPQVRVARARMAIEDAKLPEVDSFAMRELAKRIDELIIARLEEKLG